MMVGLVLGLFLVVQLADTTSEGPLVLHDSLEVTVSQIVDGDTYIDIKELASWRYHSGDSLVWAQPEYDDGHWSRISSLSEISDSLFSGVAWLRTTIKVDSSFAHEHRFLNFYSGGGSQLYIDGEKVFEHGKFSTDPKLAYSEVTGDVLSQTISLPLSPEQIINIAIRYSKFNAGYIQRIFGEGYTPIDFQLDMLGMTSLTNRSSYSKTYLIGSELSLIILAMVMILHLLMYFRFKEEQGNLWIFLITLSLSFVPLTAFGQFSGLITNPLFYELLGPLGRFLFLLPISLIPICMSKLLNVDLNKRWYYLVAYPLIPLLIDAFYSGSMSMLAQLVIYIVLILTVAYGAFDILRKAHNKRRKYLWLITGTLFSYPAILLMGSILFGWLQVDSQFWSLFSMVLLFTLLPIGFSVYQMLRFFNAHGNLQEEVNRQTAELEDAYQELQNSLENLKDTQSQLIQQEKLASLGQLTAGIAHEIKNPLNFVNNFSDLSVELVEEAKEELSDLSPQTSEEGTKKSSFEGGTGANAEAGDDTAIDEALAILDDIEANLNKINEHGSRADGIVKSMLQHSRGGDGEMEPADLNAFVEEYVNLAFHGMRAGEDPINVDIELDLDENVGEIPLIAEDFSRVIINLCNNAFDAMRKKLHGDGRPENGDRIQNYEPKLTVRTTRDDGEVRIEVEDNGPGIPEEVRDKILQPFFTTKKGTDGTGLGLSITNDIVKAHGGRIDIESDKNGTSFTISLKNQGNV